MLQSSPLHLHRGAGPPQRRGVCPPECLVGSVGFTGLCSFSVAVSEALLGLGSSFMGHPAGHWHMVLEWTRSSVQPLLSTLSATKASPAVTGPQPLGQGCCCVRLGSGPGLWCDGAHHGGRQPHRRRLPDQPSGASPLPASLRGRKGVCVGQCVSCLHHQTPFSGSCLRWNEIDTSLPFSFQNPALKAPPRPRYRKSPLFGTRFPGRPTSGQAEASAGSGEVPFSRRAGLPS